MLTMLAEVTGMSSAPTASVLASATSVRARQRGSRLRFFAAALLLVVGTSAAFLWAAATNTAVTASLAAASHGQARGLTITAHPDPYFIYSEDGTEATGISVTAPDGRALPVTPMSSSFTYGPHRNGLQVGTFEVPPGAGLTSYLVVMTAANGEGDTAIGVTTFDVSGFNRVNRWGITALLAVNIAVATALLLLPRSRFSRRKAP